MPQLEQLWNENKNRGLHIFHVESQGTTEDRLIEFCEERGITFPQTMRAGSDFSSLPGGKGIPYSYVIGVDGTVLWQGGGDGYKNTIHAELAKVRYPGLAKLEVARPVHKAAMALSKMKYSKSIALAQGLLENEDAAVVADANYVIARAKIKGERLLARAERFETARDYLDAKQTYKLLSRACKGHAPGDQATEKLALFKSDKGIKRELKAAAILAGLKEKLARKNPDTKRTTYHGFIKKFDGTRAAEKAAKIVSGLH